MADSKQPSGKRVIVRKDLGQNESEQLLNATADGAPAIPPGMPDFHATQQEAMARQEAMSGGRAMSVPLDPNAPPQKQPPVGSATVELSDGREVLMAPPTGAAVLMISKIQQAAGMLKGDQASTMYIRAILYVRAVNGVPVDDISDYPTFLQVASQIGDVEIDRVLAAYMHCWPPVTTDDLPVIKKNLR